MRFKIVGEHRACRHFFVVFIRDLKGVPAKDQP